TGTNAADSAACENRLLNRFGTWEATVKADAAAVVPKKLACTTSRPSPAIRDRAVASAKMAVLRARRRRGGEGGGGGADSPGSVLGEDTARYSTRRRRGHPRLLYVMANIHSQKKRILRAERERIENRRYTSTIKTYFHRLEQAIAASDDTAADTEHRALVQTIDKAV